MRVRAEKGEEGLGLRRASRMSRVRAEKDLKDDD